MHEKKLTWRELMLVASLIFGMFFGAGNLIFPVQLGQLSGGHWVLATIGFLLGHSLEPRVRLQLLFQWESHRLLRPSIKVWVC